jgi:hypothetical protein
MIPTRRAIIAAGAKRTDGNGMNEISTKPIDLQTAPQVQRRVETIQKALKRLGSKDGANDIALNFAVLGVLSGMQIAAIVAAGLDGGDQDRLSEYDRIIVANFRAGYNMAMRKVFDAGGFQA